MEEKISGESVVQALEDFMSGYLYYVQTDWYPNYNSARKKLIGILDEVLNRNGYE